MIEQAQAVPSDAPKDHFRNLLPELDPDEVFRLQQKLWPKIKKGKIASEELASNFAALLKIMSVKIPFQHGSGTITQNLGTGEDNYIKGSGSRELFSTALIETAMNICFSVLTILFLRDKKFDAIVGSHLEGQPGVQEICERVVKWCDAYFTKELLPGYRQNLATSLLYAITTGDAMRKIYHSPNRGYPDAALLAPGDFFFTEEDRSFYNIRGFVHAYRITKSEMEKKVADGEWSRFFEMPISEDDREIEFKTELAKQTGRSYSENEDYDEDFAEIYQGYEYYNDLSIISDPDRLPSDPYELPYTIQVGEEGIITSINHNYDLEDPLRFPYNDYIRYSLFPSYDDYNYGLANVCGQKARAATVLQRGLIDSSQLANSPTGFIAPTGRVTDRTFDLKSGKFYTLPNAENDITKSISYMPFHEPSPVVMTLMQQLENEIKQFGQMVNQDLLNLATRAPATSLLAVLQRMEQLPNAILQGLYDSFSQELRVFKRKTYEWLPANQLFSIQWQGEILNIQKEDFSSALEIVPCGQYSMESTTFKMMRAQLILDQAKELPQNHNMEQVLIRLYRDMGLKDTEIEKIVLIQKPTPPPPPMSPAEENACMLESKPIKVYSWQEHLAHYEVHSLLFNHPNPQVAANARAHAQEHEAELMVLQLQMAAGVQIPLMNDQGAQQLTPDQQNQLALALAQGAEKMKQTQQQQQPIDPGLIKIGEIKMKQQTAMIEAEIAVKKLEIEDAKHKLQAQIDALDLAIKAQEQIRENTQLEIEAHSSTIENQIKQHNLQLDHLTSQLDAMHKILEIEHKKRELNAPDPLLEGTSANSDILNQQPDVE